MKFVRDLMEYFIFRFRIWNKKILSIGCGDGVHEDILADSHFFNEVICLDNKEQYNAEKDCLPYKDNSFNVVFIKSVIEHIQNTDLFLLEIKRVLKNTGILIILTPDYQKQKDFFFDDYTHIKPFTKNSLKMALQLNNYKFVSTEWFWYYKKIWERKLFSNILPIRFAFWLTKITGIKYFRWGSDRQILGIGVKYE